MRKVAIKDIRKQDYFYSEAIKTLRTNIQLSGKSIKTILVTSCFPNEGKSDVVFQLAKEMGMATRTMPANRERICPLMMSPPSFFCTDFE